MPSSVGCASKQERQRKQILGYATDDNKKATTTATTGFLRL
jgi:hypothetical protein